jgi:hypothetical protein
MKHYQDTITGQIYAFDPDVDLQTLNNRNIPKTLSDKVIPKPNDSYVWYEGNWIKQEEAPLGYSQPISSVPSYNPAWMAYFSPYSAVYRDENSGMDITLDKINSNSYDGNHLGEIVAILPLDSSSGIPALISYDGAIAVPQCDDFPTKVDGINKLNEILCSLLLGGIHTEVLHSNALSIGSLQEKKKLFSYTPSLHTQFRLNGASISERIKLMSPRVLMVKDINDAYSQGQLVIKAIHNFSPFFLLNGYTALVYRNNSDALNNLWIVVEQLTDYLWDEKYVKNKSTFSTRVKKCHDHLKQRKQLNNIWAKQQMLRLSKIITKECHKALSMARIKRNDLVHDGIVPDFTVLEIFWRALPLLFEVASGIQKMGMNKVHCNGDNNWGNPKRTNFDEWSALAKNIDNAN